MGALLLATDVPEGSEAAVAVWTLDKVLFFVGDVHVSNPFISRNIQHGNIGPQK